MLLTSSLYLIPTKILGRVVNVTAPSQTSLETEAQLTQLLVAAPVLVGRITSYNFMP